MRDLARIVAAAAAIALLTGCSGLQDTLGLGKRAPDEFAVVKQAPLVLPPNYALRPPEPGAPRPQELQPREQAQAALTGRRNAGPGDTLRTGAGAAARSPGEQALLGQAKALNVDPTIRRQINQEFTQLVERDNSFVDKLIFWQSKPEPGTVVDPAKEQQRLREAQASGTPANRGDVPIIERRQKGWLEGIF
jgi:hypothetical protein